MAKVNVKTVVTNIIPPFEMATYYSAEDGKWFGFGFSHTTPKESTARNVWEYGDGLFTPCSADEAALLDTEWVAKGSKTIQIETEE